MGCEPRVLLRRHALALLVLLGLLPGFLLPSPAQSLTIMCFVPLAERCSVDLDNSCSGQGVRSDQFVVGRVVGDDDNPSFAGDALRTPSEVAGLETQSSEFAVAAAGTDEMDALRTDTGVGRLTAFLESSDPPSGRCWKTGDRVMHTSSCDRLRV